MKLIIIRGPSGSGKSTLARHLGGVAEQNWFEADMYMTTKDGRYIWSGDRLPHAHKWCYDMLLKAISSKQYDVVIVSDTSTRLSEANIYVELAKECGIDYEVIRTPGPWNPSELSARNEHNVPREAVERQAARYVAVPGETEWSDMGIFHGN